MEKKDFPNAQAAAIAMIQEDLRLMTRDWEKLKTLSPAAKSLLANYAVDILEAAFLAAPKETTEEYGKWLAQSLAEANGFCIDCGVACENGLCSVCKLREDTDVSGEAGSPEKN